MATGKHRYRHVDESITQEFEAFARTLAGSRRGRAAARAAALRRACEAQVVAEARKAGLLATADDGDRHDEPREPRTRQDPRAMRGNAALRLVEEAADRSEPAAAASSRRARR